MTIQQMVDEFASCVAAQETAIADSDAELGNQFADRYIKVFQALQSEGSAGLTALEGLLQDSRPIVRVTAAAWLLEHSGERARAVLKEASKGEGFAAFCAFQALKRVKQ